MSQSLREEMNPDQMVQAMRLLAGGEEHFHTHTVAELVEQMLPQLSNLSVLEFFGGDHESRAMEGIAQSFHQFIHDVFGFWQEATFKRYCDQMWPRATAELQERVTAAMARGDEAAAIAAIETYRDMTRDQLNELELGRTPIPNEVPVSWNLGGYL